MVRGPLCLYWCVCPAVSVVFLHIVVIPCASAMLMLLLLFPSIGTGGVATFVSSAVPPVLVGTAFISCVQCCLSVWTLG